MEICTQDTNGRQTRREIYVTLLPCNTSIGGCLPDYQRKVLLELLKNYVSPVFDSSIMVAYNIFSCS